MKLSEDLYQKLLLGKVELKSSNNEYKRVVLASLYLCSKGKGCLWYNTKRNCYTIKDIVEVSPLKFSFENPNKDKNEVK